MTHCNISKDNLFLIDSSDPYVTNLSHEGITLDLIRFAKKSANVIVQAPRQNMLFLLVPLRVRNVVHIPIVVFDDPCYDVTR